LTLGLVSVSIDDYLQIGEPFRNVTFHPGQLSLAIPPWVDAVSVRKSRVQTGTPRDALAMYPLSGSVNWCLNEC